MKIVNHLGSIFEFNIQKYHLENNFNKLFDSDWIDVTISINSFEKSFSVAIENFLVEDFERILDWISGVEHKTTNRKLCFVDSKLVFMRTKRNNVSFIKVIYYLAENEFVSWDLEINKDNVLDLKNGIRKMMFDYPCRCGMEHNYDKV